MVFIYNRIFNLITTASSDLPSTSRDASVSDYDRTGHLRCGICNNILVTNRALVYNRQGPTNQVRSRFIIFHRCTNTQCQRHCPLFTQVEIPNSTALSDEISEEEIHSVVFAVVRTYDEDSENTDHLNLLPPIEE